MTGALMSGCSQNHPTDDVSAGIYELTVAADADACSPTRAVGSMGPVGVVVRGTAIDAPVPDVASPTLLTAPRVILNADSFHAETNRRIPGCADAFVHEEWTLLESTGAGFELLHTQLWTGMSGCDVAADVMPGAPAADCQSERRLRYDLMEVCAEPCRLFLDASGSVSCSC
ncbi:MAG: hypothetical protein H6719_17025 [Sandaracinaceae bacterium]|nr:hypothetical protein [Sandaracinaceae bacterium]